MAYTIQLFQPVQKYYQTLGIESHQNSLFNFRNLFAIFCFLMCFTSTLAFFLFKANTILEYGATFYAFISETYILYFLFVQMWQMANISKLIASFENLIKESKHNTTNSRHKISNNILFCVIYYRITSKDGYLWRVECENRQNVWFDLLCSSGHFACGIFSSLSPNNRYQLLRLWLEWEIIYSSDPRNVQHI